MGEYKMPSLGSQMVQARLIKWHVQPGDEVHKGDIIGEIDTEKGLIDIEVFEDGIVRELIAEEGEVIPVGSVMAIIGGDRQPVEAVAKPKTVERVAPRQESKTNGKRHVMIQEKERPPDVKASPLARKVAEELHVDLSKVTGTGPGGSIHKKDVEAYAGWVEGKRGEEKETKPKTEKEVPAPKAEAASTGVSRPEAMRQAIAKAMSQSNREIPHYYLETVIDMKTAMEWLADVNQNRSLGERLLPPMLLIKAVALSLSEVTELNAYWKNDQLEIQEQINVGFAISLRKGGLVIPALQEADQLTMDELRTRFVDLVQRARLGHLTGSEIGSATTTITSLGERGADKVYGVIYPPQVALIGFGSIKERPIAVHGDLGIHPTLITTIAGDHRATDGHTGSRFLERLDHWLRHPDELFNE
jgi:pyruvate dehydrogenase E2 component (dihydrolipoamide acetyltransferase)